MKISLVIKELRRRLKFTQQRLAFETGLSVRGIAGYEIETRAPEPAPLVRLATVAARAGHHDLAYAFLNELIAQLRLDNLATGLLREASDVRPGLLLLAFADPQLNGPARAFFEAATRLLWGSEQAHREAQEVLLTIENAALQKWGRHTVMYRETEEGSQYHASNGTLYEEAKE